MKITCMPLVNDNWSSIVTDLNDQIKNMYKAAIIFICPFNEGYVSSLTNLEDSINER